MRKQTQLADLIASSGLVSGLAKRTTSQVGQSCTKARACPAQCVACLRLCCALQQPAAEPGARLLFAACHRRMAPQQPPSRTAGTASQHCTITALEAGVVAGEVQGRGSGMGGGGWEGDGEQSQPLHLQDRDASLTCRRRPTCRAPMHALVRRPSTVIGLPPAGPTAARSTPPAAAGGGNTLRSNSRSSSRRSTGDLADAGVHLSPAQSALPVELPPVSQYPSNAQAGPGSGAGADGGAHGSGPLQLPSAVQAGPLAAGQGSVPAGKQAEGLEDGLEGVRGSWQQPLLPAGPGGAGPTAGSAAAPQLYGIQPQAATTGRGTARPVAADAARTRCGGPGAPQRQDARPGSAPGGSKPALTRSVSDGARVSAGPSSVQQAWAQDGPLAAPPPDSNWVQPGNGRELELEEDVLRNGQFEEAGQADGDVPAAATPPPSLQRVYGAGGGTAAAVPSPPLQAGTSSWLPGQARLSMPPAQPQQRSQASPSRQNGHAMLLGMQPPPPAPPPLAQQPQQELVPAAVGNDIEVLELRRQVSDLRSQVRRRGTTRRGGGQINRGGGGQKAAWTLDWWCGEGWRGHTRCEGPLACGVAHPAAVGGDG